MSVRNFGEPFDYRLNRSYTYQVVFVEPAGENGTLTLSATPSWVMGLDLEKKELDNGKSVLCLDGKEASVGDALLYDGKDVHVVQRYIFQRAFIKVDEHEWIKSIIDSLIAVFVILFAFYMIASSRLRIDKLEYRMDQIDGKPLMPYSYSNES